MPKRIQRKRTKGWRMPENCVSVTRPGIFGNPFGSAESFHNWLLYRRINVFDLHDEWKPWNDEQKERLAKKRDAILLGLPSLRGKDLACFCGHDRYCHADTLLTAANA